MYLQAFPYIKLLLKLNRFICCFLNTSFTFFLPSWFCSNPSPSVFSLLYYHSWRCSLRATSSRKAFLIISLPTDSYTFTYVEHPFLCIPLASIVWTTIWRLLHASIHCYTAYIYSIFPRSRIISTVYFNPQKLELKSTQILLLIIMLM